MHAVFSNTDLPSTVAGNRGQLAVYFGKSLKQFWLATQERALISDLGVLIRWSFVLGVSTIGPNEKS